MSRRRASTLLVLIAGEFCALAQIGRYPGGQYPGGGYPPGTYPPGTYPPTAGGGIPWPRRGKDKKSRQEQDQVPQQTLLGTLRRLTDSEVVLEPEDKRILTAAVSNMTRYFRNSEDASASDFHPGDKISVDVREDGKGYFHALRITLERTGSPAERAAASRPADVSPVAGEGDSDRSGSRDADDERPRLRRQPQKAADQAGESKAEVAKPEEEPEQVISPVTVVHPENNRPDPDDGAPPKLRRGIPPKRKTVQTASAQAPSAPAPSGAPHNPGTHSPSPAAEAPRAPNPVIEKAREAAESFGETLPNYLVKQVTTRFFAQNGSARGTTWQPQDTVTADVVYENGKESYKNVLINGRPPKQKVEKTGAWSTGEFGTVLRDLFSPATNARFQPRGSDRIVNRAAYLYSFSVEQPNSHWHVYMAAQSYLPAYRGTVWIDKENYRVLRLEMQAQNLPSEFPLDTVESATDYDYVRIGGPSFLLPVHSEALSCIRGTGDCSRNVIDFRNYRKFGSEANITFDDAVKP